MSAIAVATVVSAGVGIAGAAGAFAPDTPDAPNYGQITRDSQQAQIDLLPDKYKAEAQYDPKFAALQSTIAWQNLFGTPAGAETTSNVMPAGWYDAQGNLVSADRNAYRNGPPSQVGWAGQQARINGTDQLTAPPTGVAWKDSWTQPGTAATPGSPGQLALIEAALPRVNALASSQRGQDITDVTTLGPAARAAIRSYNPQATQLLDTIGQQTQSLVDQNGALDPFLQRSLQQNYRSAEASRGFAGGPSDAAMEAYYQTATQEQRRLQNLALAGGVVGQEASYYGDPFQQVLQRTSGRGALPQINTTASQPSSIGAAGADINPAAFNLASQGYTAQNNAAIAGYNSQQQNLAALLKGFGGFSSN